MSFDCIFEWEKYHKPLLPSSGRTVKVGCYEYHFWTKGIEKIYFFGGTIGCYEYHFWTKGIEKINFFGGTSSICKGKNLWKEQTLIYKKIIFSIYLLHYLCLIEKCIAKKSDVKLSIQKKTKETNDWQVKAIAMIGRIWNIADISHIFALYTHSNVMKDGSAVKAIWKIKDKNKSVSTSVWFLEKHLTL